jgi:hypothetical protein
MTADEWDRSTDVDKMLMALGRGTDKAKFRLFPCACCRAIWGILEDDRSRTAVEVAERFALGLASKAELREAWEAAGGPREAGATRVAREAALAAQETARAAQETVWAEWELAQEAGRAARVARAAAAVTGAAVAAARAEQAELLRCLFGNPFRPAEVQPQWRTETVLQLAQSIHEGRTFDILPVLADALEEAGCTCPYTLGHCRVHRKHALGCWVVSALIGGR